MSEFLDRISKLSPQRLALLADELNERLVTEEQRQRVPLAIVGIGCRLPGNVQTPEEFWRLLENGTDAVSEVPPSRWDIDQFYRNLDTPGKMATRWGGFIGNPDQFDPKFFGIAPAEANSMDPQQRLLLETAWESLEHAAIPPSSLAGTQTGVFIGICNSDYGQVALNSPREMITPYFAPGISHAVAAGRISYVLGLQGPNLAVDTSCSASLVAVHLACQSLRLGESDTALAGGVNLVFNQDITIALSQGKMLSPDGRCKAFSEFANGFVRGEGCGVIVLKRLPDAIRDRNRILAVIRGSACNQDGRSSGLTAPNGPSQEAVIATALANAGLHPDDVDVIEAHGTGTSLGDPIEAGALNAVFASRSDKSKPLFVGSVKTNLGHLESAAGIAGLIKLVLSIQHGKIPASLHAEKLNSRIEWDRLPIKIPTSLQSWDDQQKKRVGGVSSFGFSGTNAHVILEEYPADRHSSLIANRPYLFMLSAKTETALKSVADRLHRHLVDHPTLSLADVARTLNKGRSHFEYRAALAAASHAELLKCLDKFETSRNGASLHARRTQTHSPRVSFVCPGQRSCEQTFARELWDSVPAFRESLLRCEEILKDVLDKPLTSVMYPEVEVGNRSRSLSTAEKNAIAFSLQYALAQVWIACKVEPAAVCGFGVGEFVAACVAEVLSLEDSLRLATMGLDRNSLEFREFISKVSVHSPRIPMITGSDGHPKNDLPIASQEDWLLHAGSNPSDSVRLSALVNEGCVANLVLSGKSSLADFSKYLEANPQLAWLASFGNGESDLRQLLNAAASLYIAGFEPDLGGFYNDEANMVSLPTYPFERERYWLTPEVSAKTLPGVKNVSIATQPVESLGKDEWTYQLEWDSKPISQLQRSAKIDLDDLIGNRAVSPATAELIRVEHLTAALMPIYATYVVRALEEAGLTPKVGEAFTLEELSERLKVIPARRRVLARMLSILVEDGVMNCTDGRFEFIDIEARPDANEELSRLGDAYPECATEIIILRRCGNRLAAVLQGAYDPMQLVFADGSINEAEEIYQDSPVCQFFNGKSSTLIRDAVNRIHGRPVRILEIGGGTGATTVSILPVLAESDFEYTFTDVSPSFLFKARGKFADVPSMQYRVLDIEKDPIDQGYQSEAYDIVIAANVLHATADLRVTISNVRKLLKPGGILLMIEGTRPDRWLDLTFGLTDGWFRFTDLELRPTHPLISKERWAQVLHGAGIKACRTISYIQSDGKPSQQHIIVGQTDYDDTGSPRPSQKPDRDWLILSDNIGVGDALHQLLTSRGESSKVIRRPASRHEAQSVLRELISGPETGTLEIVYLWGMDVVEPVKSIETLSGAAEWSGNALVHLIQLQTAHGAGRSGLWIITRGAQATDGYDPTATGPVQALAWGIGRTLGLEDPTRFRALIDLDSNSTPEAAAQCLLAELMDGDKEDQVAYRDGCRLAARIKRSHWENLHTSPFSGLRAEGSYLLTGGLGGVGLKLATWAAMNGARSLVLLGRTGTEQNAGRFAEERRKVITNIKSLGVTVTLVEGDISSNADMQALFQRFGHQLPPLLGIFHAATAISSAELANLTDEQWNLMLRAKVQGTWLLHEQTKRMKLDFFLAFSSTTSLLGARQMAHYAAANQFLDSFAHYRRSLGLPMLSINWGAWDVMRWATGKQQASIAESGILPMPAEKALSLLGELISLPRSQVMIANMDWEVLKPLYELHRIRPLLENVGNQNPEHKKSNLLAVPVQASLVNANGMAPKKRKEFISRFVQTQAGLVLGFRSEDLPATDIALSELGLDSLMAVDLKNRLQLGLGQELSPTMVFDYPTISEMAEMLETMLWAAHGSSEGEFASSQKEEIRI